MKIFIVPNVKTPIPKKHPDNKIPKYTSLPDLAFDSNFIPINMNNITGESNKEKTIATYNGGIEPSTGILSMQSNGNISKQKLYNATAIIIINLGFICFGLKWEKRMPSRFAYYCINQRSKIVLNYQCDKLSVIFLTYIYRVKGLSVQSYDGIGRWRQVDPLRRGFNIVETPLFLAHNQRIIPDLQQSKLSV